MRPRVQLAVLTVLLFAVFFAGTRLFDPGHRAAAPSDRLRRLVLGSLGGAPQSAVLPDDGSILAVTATIGRGEDIAAALTRAGVAEADAMAVTAALAAKFARMPVIPGTSLDLILKPGTAPGLPRQLVSLQMQSGIDLKLRAERRGGLFAVTAASLPVDATPLRIEGAIGENFTRSALDAGAPAEAVQAYLQALDAHSPYATDLRPDDKFDMVIDYKLSPGGERQAGGLLMARLERGGKPLVELLKNRSGAYVSSAAPADGAQDAKWPVSGHLTSGFGMRFHPILGYERMHSGVDLAAPTGTPIRAVRSGVVSFAGWSGGHGEYVMIRHADGLVSGYGHMSRIAVTVGTPVEAGAVIGSVGATGLATGPHLHFELFRGGRAIDPATIEQPQLAGPARQREWGELQKRFAWFKRLIPGAALRAAQPAQSNTGIWSGPSTAKAIAATAM